MSQESWLPPWTGRPGKRACALRPRVRRRALSGAEASEGAGVGEERWVRPSTRILPGEEQWEAGRRGRAGGGAGPLSTSSVLVGGTKGRGARVAEGSHRQAEPAAMALVGPVIWDPRRDVYLLLLLLLLLPPWVQAGECGWA